MAQKSVPCYTESGGVIPMLLAGSRHINLDFLALLHNYFN